MTILCVLCFFSIGSVVHTLLECPYFDSYYKTIRNIAASLYLENLNFNLSTLICGYKASDKHYQHVNEVIQIIYYTAYKTCVQFQNGKRFNPLQTLKFELSARTNTKTYKENQFMKKFLL